MEKIQEQSKTREIFRAVKSHFREKLGKYTHQRVSGDWHFHGLAFVRDEMTYVFGFNVGFFRKDISKGYDTVGMNVLVRTNGAGKKLREKFDDFFKKELEYWYLSRETYTSFRGGLGNEYGRYKKIDDFDSDEDIISFIKEGIDELNKLYPIIINNPDDIFDDVMRASYPWHDTILDVCNNILNKQSKQ